MKRLLSFALSALGIGLLACATPARAVDCTLLINGNNGLEGFSSPFPTTWANSVVLANTTNVVKLWWSAEAHDIVPGTTASYTYTYSVPGSLAGGGTYTFPASPGNISLVEVAQHECYVIDSGANYDYSSGFIPTITSWMGSTNHIMITVH